MNGTFQTTVADSAVGSFTVSVQTQAGTKAFLPEAAIRELVTQKVITPFRAGDYGTGLLETVRGLAQVYAQRFDFVLESG